VTGKISPVITVKMSGVMLLSFNLSAVMENNFCFKGARLYICILWVGAEERAERMNGGCWTLCDKPFKQKRLRHEIEI
jgi:hypothetical protein